MSMFLSAFCNGCYYLFHVCKVTEKSLFSQIFREFNIPRQEAQSEGFLLLSNRVLLLSNKIPLLSNSRRKKISTLQGLTFF